MNTNDKNSPNEDHNNEHIEGRTELDKFKAQQTVDEIPLEDLKIEQKEEKKKHKSKDDSQSERKYRKGEKRF